MTAKEEAGAGGDEVVDGPVAEYLRTEVARDFFELMTEGDKPLYPGMYKFLIYSNRLLYMYIMYVRRQKMCLHRE